MKKLNVIIQLSLGLFALCVANLRANTDPKKLLIDGLQGNPDVFELIELRTVGKTTDFEVTLGKSVLTLETGEKFDGFRFKTPEGSAKSDLVWYFNAPSNWANWYLCPVEGEFKPSFRTWLNADKLYEQFDQAGDENRTRILQKLDAGYFRSGEEYIMWFRQIESGNSKLTGRIMLTDAREDWGHEEIENGLGLKAMATEIQI
ncbi:MAG: hypothetical protein Q7Q71_05040 [Verrucomicrobiota bacterium JB023]|nr:hypothetical protein [Verrucomicrobiota bacterium JB023]